MQFDVDTNVPSLCANPYCQRGSDGGRQLVALRDIRGKESFCSQACQAMMRYKKRYKGTNAGPVDSGTIRDKMNNL